MISDVDDYNILTRSMRECYIPAEQWLRYIEDVESNQYYRYQYCDEVYDTCHDMYVLPYPFRRSYFHDYAYVSELNGRTITKDNFGELDMSACKDAVDERTYRYLRNAVHESVISWIDGNSDYGVILHSTSGLYFPFQYSATSGFCFACASASGILDQASAYLRKSAETEDDIRKVETLQQKIMTNRGKFFLTYALQYKTADGDDFFSPGHYGDLTEYTTLDAFQVKATRDYMQEMYENHAKTFIVT